MEIMTQDEAKEAIASENLCKAFGFAVQKAYPHRNWYVEVLDKCMICVVKIPELSMEHGQIIHLADSTIANTNAVVKGAGELLERFNLTRGVSDNHDLMSLQRNAKGVSVAAAGGE